MKKLILISWVFMTLLACAKGEKGDKAAPVSSVQSSKKVNGCDSDIMGMLMFENGYYRVSLFANGIFMFEMSDEIRRGLEYDQSGRYEEIKNEISDVQVFKLGRRVIVIDGFYAKMTGVQWNSELKLIVAGEVELTEAQKKIVCAVGPEAVP